MIDISAHNGFLIKKIKNDTIELYPSKHISDFYRSIDVGGKNIIDGGSSVGVYALAFSYLTNGFVYCFEMQPMIYSLCIDNVTMNKRDNIVCFNMALSDKSGVVVGFTPIDYASDNVSSVGIRMEPTGQIEILTTAIDDMEFKNVGLIKLDIEGSEPKALEGAWKTIDRDKPYMIIELSPVYLENKQQETIDKIISHGYTVEAIGDCNYICKPI